MTIPNNDAAALRSQPFTMRYDAMTVTHTTQFVLCANDEQLVLECSSGLVTGDDVPTLPIHSRLALPWTAATRLHELLERALQGQTAAQRRSPRGSRSRRVVDSTDGAASTLRDQS